VSLVLEALRRVEKPDARAGSIGVAVSSYRPRPRPRGFAIPLLLGLATGGALILLFAPTAGRRREPDERVGAGVSAASAPTQPKGRAGLPPPLILEPLVLPESPAPAARPGPLLPNPAPGPDRGSEAPLPASVPRPALVLQAISERESHPVAIINDQLVKEGDKLGTVRVVRIGEDSVEVLLENGKKDIVRFSPPVPPEASPSPEARQEGAPPRAFHP
jgi:hypothetical protein